MIDCGSFWKLSIECSSLHHNYYQFEIIFILYKDKYYFINSIINFKMFFFCYI